MPRQLEQKEPYIVVFYEGENGQAYTDFLKEEFKDVAPIKRPSPTGPFEEADSKFKKDKFYRDCAEVAGEIRSFFNVETKDVQRQGNRLKIVKRLRSLRKKPGVKVRLLVTTRCVEYWFMLHYKMFTPSIQAVAEKGCIIAELIEKVPNYQEGDLHSISKIAHNHPEAVKNSKRTLSNLLQDGLPSLDDTSEHNYRLYRNYLTLSSVYEAINSLANLQWLFF